MGRSGGLSDPIDVRQPAVTGLERPQLAGLDAGLVDLGGLELIQLELLTTQLRVLGQARSLGKVSLPVAVGRRQLLAGFVSAREGVEHAQLVAGLEKELMIVLAVDVDQPLPHLL